MSPSFEKVMQEDLTADPLRTPESRPQTFDDSHQSALKLYSLGIAANNKTVGTDIIYATPIETISLQDGELISTPFDQKAEGFDMEDKLYQTKVITDTALKCTWIGANNRRTSPDIRRGERVLIYRFADRDEFMWESLAQDERLRKLETVVFSISGTKDEKTDGTLPENSYFLEMSSHKGLVTFSTSKKNGEYTTYAAQFNTKEGWFTLSDALGNNIHLNSKDTLIELENADKTIIQLTKQNIKMNAPDSITMEAANDIKMEAGGEIEMKSGGDITAKPGGKFIVDGQSQFTGTVQMDAMLTATGINSPTVPITGPSDAI